MLQKELGSFMVSPPFATAKAGDDVPFRKPSTTGVSEMPKKRGIF